MSAPLLRSAFAVALVACAPEPALGLDLSGQIGAIYNRTDTWAQGHEVVPQLTLDGGLRGNGNLFGPEMIGWGGGVRYQNLRQTYSGTPSDSTSLTYDANASLFNTPESRLTLLGLASRSRVDFSVEPSSAQKTTGTTVIDTYGAQAMVKDDVRPGLTVGASQSQSTNSGFGRPDTIQNLRRLDVATRHAAGPARFDVNYGGTWSDGTLEPINFASHMIQLNAAAALASGVDGNVHGAYFVREPSALSPANPRIEDTQALTSVRWTGSLPGQAQYTYAHAVLSSPVDDRERVQQSLGTQATRTFSDDWQAYGMFGVSMDQDRSGTVEALASGQSLGGAVRWNTRGETRRIGVEAGPTVNLLEPAQGSMKVGYGGQGRAMLDWTPSAAHLSLDYAVSYAQDANAVAGWTLSQSVHGDANAPLAPDLQGRATILFSAMRQDTAIFGSSASRSLSAQAALGYRSYQLVLDVGITDGVSGALASPVRGDGLFLPASYDTHSRFAALLVDGVVLRRLRYVARARYTVLSGPEFPAQREASLSGQLEYPIGAFAFALEDRWTIGGASGFDYRSNLLFVRVSRSFGVRF